VSPLDATLSCPVGSAADDRLSNEATDDQESEGTAMTGRSGLAIIAILVALALGGILVGALTSSTSAPAGSTATSSTLSPDPVTTSTTVVTPTYVASENARADVSETGCGVIAGALTMTGTVHNPLAATRTYTIVVNFESAMTDSVSAVRVVTVSGVASHQSGTWTSRGPTQAVGLTCVIEFAIAVPSS
jgi:hypothetical protein